MVTMNEYAFWILAILLPAISFLYASVGHGGASSYILMLTLFNFAPEKVKPAALILNIIVSFIAFVSYRKACNFPIRIFILLALFSIPASFIGGSIPVEPSLYRKILGVLLLFPVLRFLGVLPVSEKKVTEVKWWLLFIIGGSIGFVSGIIGIGGGIILSPILLLLGWTSMKETAALSALFIFVNSIAGYLGAGAPVFQNDSALISLMPLTIIGGIAGAYLGAQRFNVQTVKYLLTTVLLIASIKLIGG